jgi:thiol-disulfide isomerase/thioredoxin
MLSRGTFAAVVILFLAAAVPVCKAETARVAPPLDGVLLDGKPFHLSDHRGRVVIIHFWATWCAPCRVEMIIFNTYYQKHHKEGLDMLAISMDDRTDLDKVSSAMKSFSFPAALYDNTQADDYGRITQLPQTLIVGRNGVLHEVGRDDPVTDIAQLEKTVTPLLARHSSEKKSP